MNRILIFVCFATVIPLCGCSETVQPEPGAKEPGNHEPMDELVESAQADTNSGSKEMAEKTMAGDTKAIVYGDQFPEVLAVTAVQIKDNNWRFNVTLSSTYDTPERYADAWRVLDSQGNELGIRVLGHGHGNEQPFTRSGTIDVPDGSSTVFVEGRDQANGWSGQRFKFELP